MRSKNEWGLRWGRKNAVLCEVMMCVAIKKIQMEIFVQDHLKDCTQLQKCPSAMRGKNEWGIMWGRYNEVLCEVRMCVAIKKCWWNCFCRITFKIIHSYRSAPQSCEVSTSKGLYEIRMNEVLCEVRMCMVIKKMLMEVFVLDHLQDCPQLQECASAMRGKNGWGIMWGIYNGVLCEVRMCVAIKKMLMELFLQDHLQDYPSYRSAPQSCEVRMSEGLWAVIMNEALCEVRMHMVTICEVHFFSEELCEVRLCWITMCEARWEENTKGTVRAASPFRLSPSVGTSSRSSLNDVGVEEISNKLQSLKSITTLY